MKLPRIDDTEIRAISVDGVTSACSRSQILVCEGDEADGSYPRMVAFAVRFGELASSEARPSVRHGSTNAWSNRFA